MQPIVSGAFTSVLQVGMLVSVLEKNLDKIDHRWRGAKLGRNSAGMAICEGEMKSICAWLETEWVKIPEKLRREFYEKAQV